MNLIFNTPMLKYWTDLSSVCRYVDLLWQPQTTASVTPENLQLARETIDSLQLAELENFFRLVCLDANPVIIEQLTEQNDHSATVIYRIFLDNRWEIIVKFTQQPLRHYTTTIEDKKLVARILERLPQSLNQANSQETRSLAQQLYNWLLLPLQADLAQSQLTHREFLICVTMD
jgi:CHAT domain-containing protein